MQSKTQKILMYSVIFVIVIILTIALLLYFYPKAEQEVDLSVKQEPTGQDTLQPITDINKVVDTLKELNLIDEIEPVLSEETSLLAMARSFTERFGSYSNQGRYENFDALRSWMTPELRDWVDGYKKELEKEFEEYEYYGIETKVVKSEISSLDEDKGIGEVTVSTQRQEFINSEINPRVYYQDAKLKLLKDGDQWRVSNVFWQ